MQLVQKFSSQHSMDRQYALTHFSSVLADRSSSEELRRHAANSMLCVLIIGTVFAFGVLAFIYLLVDRLDRT